VLADENAFYYGSRAGGPRQGEVAGTGEPMSEPSTEADRPTVSRRDPAELQPRLEAWLRSVLPAGAEPVVKGLRSPERNGMSSETLLFDLEHGAGADRRAGSYVARMAPEDSAVPVFPTYDFDKQFRVMRLVAGATSVPVPAAPWFEPDAAALGSPFFVMERVEGEVPPDVMPYNFGDSWLYDASPDDQARLQRASVATLAEIHSIDLSAVDAAFLELERPEPTPLRRHVGDQWDYYRWMAGDRRQPLIERCFAWLEDHWPDDEGPAALSWGDSRIGNMLYRDFAPVAVLDWEMAGIAPREMDLAWMVFLHRFFEDLAAQLDLPGMPGFLQLSDAVDTYEQASGCTPRHLEFFVMYAALRHGIVMSRVGQRSAHFGEAELPDDPDDLIMHRSTLEAMLDGTYWPKLGL
jgi:aminoglycoside phosphotransferase (APT) family kinase protein